MKILHITQSTGGVDIYIRQIIMEIDPTKFEIILVLPQDATALEEFCKARSVITYKIKMSRGLKPFQDLRNIFQFKKIIKETKPDLVHLHSAKAGFLGRIATKLTRKKSTFTPNGVSYLSFSGLKRMSFFSLELFAKRYTQHILAASHSEALRMNFEVGIPKEKVKTILNSIALGDKDREWKKRGNIIKIGATARLTYQKNPLLFIEIAKAVIKKYDNVEFSIMGYRDDDDQAAVVIEELKKLNLGDKFKIHKWGDKDFASNYLQNLDVLLFPSLFEGLPLSLLECMSLAIPCVVSTCDGNKDVIHNNENGFACITADEYVEKISLLIEDETVAQKIGVAGQVYVRKHHNLKDFAKKLEQYYTQIIES